MCVCICIYIYAPQDSGPYIQPQNRASSSQKCIQELVHVATQVQMLKHTPSCLYGEN